MRGMLSPAQCSPGRFVAFGLLLASVQAINPVLPAGRARAAGSKRLALLAAGASVQPEVDACRTHVKELVARLEKQYTGVQLENALVSFCITSAEFGGKGGKLEDGFDSRHRCERYAHKLVAARDAEATGKQGGYTDFCRAYHGVVVEEPAPKAIVEEPKEVSPAPAQRRSFVGAGLLLFLLVAACLFCLAGIFAKKKAAPPPPKPIEYKDWLQVARELFDQYDVDNSGYLDQEEFRRLLDDLASVVTREYTTPRQKADVRTQLKRELDTGSGKVSKQEFLTNVKDLVEDILES